MRGAFLVLLSFALMAVLPACGDDGNGGDGGGDDLTGVFLTAGNAELVGGLAASSIDVFPGLTEVMRTVLERIDALASSPHPLAGTIDLGDLGFCSTGSATGSWIDADGNQALSAGDAFEVTVTDCDSVDGTLSAAFLEVGLESGSADLELHITFRDEVDGSLETRSMDGKFRLEVDHSGPPGTIVFRYLVPETTDGSRSLTATRNGVPAYQMGCFNFYFILSETDGSFTLSEPVAVYKVPGQGVVSLWAIGLPALQFPHGDNPVSGQLSFWGQAFILPCASLGIPSGGVDSNESSLTLTVSEGGGVVLSGQTDLGEPFSLQTSWDELR